jgi:hypothetical protein
MLLVVVLVAVSVSIEAACAQECVDLVNAADRLKSKIRSLKVLPADPNVTFTAADKIYVAANGAHTLLRSCIGADPFMSLLNVAVCALTTWMVVTLWRAMPDVDGAHKGGRFDGEPWTLIPRDCERIAGRAESIEGDPGARDRARDNFEHLVRMTPRLEQECDVRRFERVLRAYAHARTAPYIAALNIIAIVAFVATLMVAAWLVNHAFSLLGVGLLTWLVGGGQIVQGAMKVVVIVGAMIAYWNWEILSRTYKLCADLERKTQDLKRAAGRNALIRLADRLDPDHRTLTET